MLISGFALIFFNVTKGFWCGAGRIKISEAILCFTLQLNMETDKGHQSQENIAPLG